MTDYRYKLTITLLEDLHSGTGAGTVIVDRVQARDERNRPVLNRTHLKGVLRDNAQRLAGLGVLDATLIKKVFGDAGDQAGNLECQSLRLQQSVATLLWDATTRQPGSRVPEDDSLRRTEYVPAGTIFTGDMILHDADEDMCGLVKSVLRFTDRLGSERTRGSGLITLEFSKEPIIRQTAPVDFAGQETNSLCLRLLLRNDEPLCLPRTGFPGNIIDSETYIPGRALFSALCRWALQHQPGDARAQLLFGRQFSIGNAYPLPRGLKDDPADSLATLAVYPIPLNLYSIKSNVFQANSKTTTNTQWPHWCDSKPLARRLSGSDRK